MGGSSLHFLDEMALGGLWIFLWRWLLRSFGCGVGLVDGFCWMVF